jgi:hypothetical protein
MIRDDSMTMQEKIIYMEILSLSSLDKGCIASNAHFEKCFGISKKSVSNTISKLIEKGFISSELKDRNYTRILSIKNGQVSIKSGESKENKTNTTSSYDEYLNLWNEFATKNNKSKVAKLSDSRKKKIALRLKEYKNLLEIFKFVLTKSEKSKFLLNGSFYTFDWLFDNDTNILKVYEGKYDNKLSDFQEVII